MTTTTLSNLLDLISELADEAIAGTTADMEETLILIRSLVEGIQR